MDVGQVLALYDREQRREIDYPDMRKDILPHLVRFVRDRPGMSFVLYSDLDETTADAAIDEQIAYFRERDLIFEWKVYGHDRPADLVERLVARGFEAEEPDAIMVLDVEAAPPALLAPPAVDVRRILDPAQLTEVAGILEKVWGEDFNWIYGRLGSHMAIPGYLSIYVAYAGDVPASAGWIYFHPGDFAGLWGGSTLEEYRGRGLYSALLAVRVQEARARGVRYLTIDAGEMSRPIVARHGFEVITYATACEWKGGEIKN
ncbi:GNAT family N-acetyltransferase [Promineifilum sp.]|uniref:GNAT family N-acetyltransferase n=1 Tax=Promineifilum sp. TaxID=2664178 RepID=UPI0035B4253B